MSLLIACLLIYNFQMPAWWYAVAVVVSVLKWIAYDKIIKSNVESVVYQVRQKNDA